MTLYEILDVWARAIQGDATVKAYCLTNFSKGCLVQVDEDMENLLKSSDAPYVQLFSMENAENSPVSDGEEITIRMIAGIVDQSVKPHIPAVTNERTATENGYRKYGAGEKAETLLRDSLAAIRNVTLGEGQLIYSIQIEIEGVLWFPLQVARATMTIRGTKSLSTW